MRAHQTLPIRSSTPPAASSPETAVYHKSHPVADPAGVYEELSIVTSDCSEDEDVDTHPSRISHSVFDLDEVWEEPSIVTSESSEDGDTEACAFCTSHSVSDPDEEYGEFSVATSEASEEEDVDTHPSRNARSVPSPDPVKETPEETRGSRTSRRSSNLVSHDQQGGQEEQSGQPVHFSKAPLSLSTIGIHPRPGYILHFHCPIQPCNMDFDVHCTYDRFTLHIASHAHEFHSMGWNICPFGCLVGFIDAFQQRQHVTLKCSSLPPVPPRPSWPQTCKYAGCQTKFADEAALRQHCMKKHGSVAYAKANHAFKDHTCQKGIADARDLHQHMIAMVSSGSHLQVIFSGFDVAKIVTMSLCTSGDPQLLDAGPAGVAVPHAIDILRSSVCHPPLPRTYHFHLLSRKLLNTNDLLASWENKVRSIRMAFQLPEISARCLPGSIYSSRVLAWKIPNFVPNAMVRDPSMYLFPSISGASTGLHPQAGLPSQERLEEMYSIAAKSETTHLIFVFRHGGIPSKNHELKHVREVMATVSRTHSSGIAKIASISIICGKWIQGCFVPSFDHDIDTEVRPASKLVVSARRPAKSITEFLSRAVRASEFTIRIKSRMIDAIVAGHCPVVVSMDSSVLSHNWDRFSLLCEEFEDTEAPLFIWLRLSDNEAWGIREEENSVLCHNQLGTGSIGHYTSIDIVKHQKGKWK